MTYEQVVAKVKAKFADADASAIDGVVALQINLEGKNVNGIFYIEVKDHSVNVEPYEYYDRHAIVISNVRLEGVQAQSFDLGNATVANGTNGTGFTWANSGGVASIVDGELVITGGYCYDAYEITF